MTSMPIYDNQGQPHFPTSVSVAELAAARQVAAARTQAAIDARKKDEAEAKADVARRQAEQGAAELESYRVEARAAFLSSGGDVDGFLRNWPTMRDEHLRGRAADRVTLQERTIAKTKEELRASGRYSW